MGYTVINKAGLVDQEPRGLWRAPLSRAQLELAVQFGTEIVAKSEAHDNVWYSHPLFKDRKLDLEEPIPEEKPLARIALLTPFAFVANACAKAVWAGQPVDSALIDEITANSQYVFRDGPMLILYRAFPRLKVFKVLGSADFLNQIGLSGSILLFGTIAKAGILIGKATYPTRIASEDHHDGFFETMLVIPWPANPCESLHVFLAVSASGWFAPRLDGYTSFELVDFH